MAVPTDTEELRLAWSALAGQDVADGWVTIPLGGAGPRFRAGIHYPGGYETLLVGFSGITMPKRADLPAGRGFTVSAVPEAAGSSFTQWIGVSRQPNAPDDMFTQMAADIVGSLAVHAGRAESWLFGLLLARIRAWQDFMRSPRAGILSAEAELGLAGELIMIEALVAAGADAGSVVDAWQGPARSLQDFLFAVHGLEVKTSLSVNGFPASISSLEQLDAALGRVVLLAAVRLCIQQTGRKLPEIVAECRALLDAHTVSINAFELQLLNAGYFDSVSAEYVRAFEVVDIRIFPVDDLFPGLMRSLTKPEIRSAEYVLDLDLVSVPSITVADLTSHGVF
ncbi:PD-(D/E)XK motif protein [Sphingomonas sp. CFBP 13714]|uniref:PD-(D/E)XK motif protein n=1 Tax=Sphingomonas sp. CFBP 13714 TaxID=2775308 RepID=UPI0017820AEA|nr:PD-(D/E)XK motif protein [Sphingomonas sp. CFBP 13714]MBD8699012.1 PD-(D/E)XK motif protein [Sphingomonas sp. CFBP 13714]